MKNSTLWWTSMATGKSWSREEQWTRGAIYMVGLVLFVPFNLLIGSFFNRHGVEKHVGALTALLICVPPSYVFGRLVCARLWPDYVKRADENAAKRLGDR
ncbi:MAG TPA: hypothetical protein VMA53_00205 [Stellaceae bacterium]|nr:hypothetical protein [Stellaceae bacterium]